MWTAPSPCSVAMTFSRSLRWPPTRRRLIREGRKPIVVASQLGFDDLQGAVDDAGGARLELGAHRVGVLLALGRGLLAGGLGFLARRLDARLVGEVGLRAALGQDGVGLAPGFLED